ncbi:MAG: hypothetical protein LLG00_16110 [Planctomycetaceae bacterium]|nr:hypothetical protein [Planctomycetaceae bacterium]
MPNAFDPYRDALVIETETVWPADLKNAPQDAAQRRQLEGRLHAAPAEAAELDYVRLHAGFARKVIVTEADLDRLQHAT